MRTPGRVNWLAAALMSGGHLGRCSSAISRDDRVGLGLGRRRSALLAVGLVVCAAWVVGRGAQRASR